MITTWTVVVDSEQWAVLVSSVSSRRRVCSALADTGVNSTHDAKFASPRRPTGQKNYR